MNLDKIIREKSLYLKKHSIENPILEIRLFIKEVMKINVEEQIVNNKLLIKKKDLIKLNSMIEKRARREPFARIIGKKYFRNIELEINNSTLIPRDDSETILDAYFSLNFNIEHLNILDLGTGSGALLISFLLELPNSRGIGLDKSYYALSMAKKNSATYNLSNRIEFLCCNWLDAIKIDEFDLIIANPPYIQTNLISELEPEVSKYEPRIALDGGTDGLDSYREILGQIKKRAAKQILVIFEIGYDQSNKVAKLMKSSGIINIRVHKDIMRNDRCLSGVFFIK